MGVDMELEFEKYCVVGGSPKTVLPSPRQCSKIEKRKVIGRPKCRDDLLSQNEDFTEIRFRSYRSASCRSIPCMKTVLEGDEVLKRGSVYQSSKEVSKMKKMGAVEGRRKIELPRGSATAFSFGIADSLCSSDEDSSLVERNRFSLMSLNSESNTSVSKPHSSQNILDLSCCPVPETGVSSLSSDSFLEITLDSDNIENRSAKNVEEQSIEDSKCRWDTAVTPLVGGNGLWERDPAFALHKSLSAKLELPHSPISLVSDCSKASSPKTRFSPIRKMFDPFVKSKSQRSPLGSAIGPGEGTPTGLVNITRSKTLRKSLLTDFSNTAQSKQCDSHFIKEEYHKKSLVPCSPAHLRGLLKLENKHGVPFFEFSVKFPEDVFVAKTWKVGNALNWVYTFHSVHNKRKSNVTGWGLKDSAKESSMVGQMQVSCYLCTELKDAGAFDNSMVTEFVLYDTVQARKSVAAQDNTYSSPYAKPPKGPNENSTKEICELDEVSNQSKLKFQPKHVRNCGRNDLSRHPWAAADLHSNVEIAAIVIQIPFEKRESLKCKGGDRKSDQTLPDLLDLSQVEQRKKDFLDCLSPAKVSVVTPSGNHSLPTTESHGPSPLLDRWRLGGGCDCGGWDMGCPLVVFGNPNIQYAEDHPILENEQPLELFVQGTKVKTPALTMTIIEEGRYAVDFHAQLTTLQAFSICVAILHSTEASISVGQVKDKQWLQCDSLRVLVGEEVKFLIEAVTEEEKRKASVKMEETPPSFVLNPPFSPIARV